MKRYRIAVTTAADGTVVAFSPRISGKVHSIQYVKGDYADGVDIAVTDEATGENIWTQANMNASVVVYPRAPTHSQAGAAALFASGGTAILDKIGVANSRIKISIAQGGNAKSGTFHILMD